MPDPWKRGLPPLACSVDCARTFPVVRLPYRYYKRMGGNADVTGTYRAETRAGQDIAMLSSHPLTQTYSTTLRVSHDAPGYRGYTAADYTYVSIPGDFDFEPKRVSRVIGREMVEVSFCGEEPDELAVFRLINKVVNENIAPDSEGIQELALVLFSSVEIPVRNSPIRGVTLGSLLSSGGLSGMIALGKIDLEHASIAVLFGAGTIIIFGAAKGVATALERGLDRRVSRALSVTTKRAPKVERNKRIS
jgi:hypothetical protein